MNLKNSNMGTSEISFYDIVMQRYATKLFNGKKISKDKFDQLLEMIRFSPSSFNIQPWKIKIIEDMATKEKLQAAAWNQPQVTTCSHYLVFCVDSNVSGLADKLEKLLLDAAIPSHKVKAYMGMVRPFFQKLSHEEQVHWLHRQVYLALGNAMNAAKSLGFDSCPMEGLDPLEFAKILKLPKHLVVSAGLAIGYAADVRLQKLRFSKEEIFI